VSLSDMLPETSNDFAMCTVNIVRRLVIELSAIRDHNYDQLSDCCATENQRFHNVSLKSLVLPRWVL